MDECTNIALKLIDLQVIKALGNKKKGIQLSKYYKKCKPKALNMSYIWPEHIEARSPVQVSVSNLEILISLFEKNHSLIKKFGMQGMALLAIDPIYHEFQIKVSELQRVDLSLLDSDEDRFVFWCNIYNTLALHSYISEHKNIPKGLSELNCMGFLSGHKYNISGLSFSLYQIDHAIIRAPLHYPDVMFASSVSNSPSLLCLSFPASEC